jgi:hypothetical protein
MAATKIKVHSDLRNCVQICTLVDDQWIEFARIWYGPERLVEDKETALQWADLVCSALALSADQIL